MKNLPNINLSKKEFNECLANRIFTGGEAFICESQTSDTIFKFFHSHKNLIPMSENKEKKINELYKKQLNHCTLPISTISVDGVLYGYEMYYEEFFKTYKLYEIAFDNEQLLHFLKETKKILEYFTAHNIIYGDFDTRNILFNRDTGEVIFCDMDNIQLDDYPIDKIPCSLGDYYLFTELDDGVHPYMHNKMLLRAINSDIYFISNYEIWRYFKRPAKKIIEGMRNPEFFDNEYLIDHIKKLNR